MRKTSVGPWIIQTDLARVVLTDTRDGSARYTNVTLFPVGYRVGQQWSGGDVPKYVDAAARKLVNQSAAAAGKKGVKPTMDRQTAIDKYQAVQRTISGLQRRASHSVADAKEYESARAYANQKVAAWERASGVELKRF